MTAKCHPNRKAIRHYLCRKCAKVHRRKLRLLNTKKQAKCHPSRKRARDSWCRQCYKRRRRNFYLNNSDKLKMRSSEWYENNKERAHYMNRKWCKRNPDKILNIRLKYKYGITLDDYDIYFKLQKGRCGICKTKKLCRNGRFYVDHNHKTNEFRGLLCNKCNVLLGMINDRIKLLKRAIRYLKQN